MGLRDSTLGRRSGAVRREQRSRGEQAQAKALRERRLSVQQLARRTMAAPKDVVGWLGAVQAQDYAGAKWAVALRVAIDISERSVESAIGEGSILRMHVMRWTWQFVLPEDARWMLALVRPRLLARAARRDRELELDAATFRKSNTVLDRALRDGQHRTRPELAALLGRAGISPADQRLSHLLARAEIDGIVCSGPRRGKQFTYAHLDHRAPIPATRLARDEALAALARRYFRSRGPALLDDFIWWSGLSAADARAALDAVRPSLAVDLIDGRTYFSWDAPTSGAPFKSGRGDEACLLLPAFDEYLVAYRHRDALIDSDHVKLVNAGTGMLNPSVVIGGRVIGAWRRDLLRDRATLEIELFEPLTTKHESAITRAVERFGRFLGVDARLARLSQRRRGAP